MFPNEGVLYKAGTVSEQTIKILLKFHYLNVTTRRSCGGRTMSENSSFETMFSICYDPEFQMTHMKIFGLLLEILRLKICMNTMYRFLILLIK